MANHLLMVEDSPSDIELTREALDTFDNDIEIILAKDGVEAVEYIESLPAGINPPPDLILLDIEMPRKNGFEVLEKIKHTKETREIPVVVMTLSAARGDIDRAYRLGANCCITKPLGFNDFRQILQSLNNFWFEIATLPGSN